MSLCNSQVQVRRGHSNMEAEPCSSSSPLSTRQIRHPCKLVDCNWTVSSWFVSVWWKTNMQSGCIAAQVIHAMRERHLRQSHDANLSQGSLSSSHFQSLPRHHCELLVVVPVGMIHTFASHIHKASSSQLGAKTVGNNGRSVACM